MSRPPVDHGHGHYRTYDKGCRCDACRNTNREKSADYRRRLAQDGASADRAGHGRATTYQNHGCRCAPCTAANTKAARRYRAARPDNTGA